MVKALLRLLLLFTLALQALGCQPQPRPNLRPPPPSPTPVDCSWGAWEAWTSCSVTCGGGSQTSMRIEAQQAQYGGQTCTGESTRHRNCNEEGCPVDCSWDMWGTWSSCTVTCGGGSQTSKRTEAQQVQNGGQSCTGESTRQRNCNEEGCSVDCSWGMWETWSPCTKTCGGVRTSKREVKQEAQNGGTKCVGEMTKGEDCHAPSCPQDCVWSEWMPWERCSKSCNRGTRATLRFPQVLPLNGGKDCDMMEVVKQGECNIHACPCFLRETWPEPESGLLMLGEDEFENDCSYCKPYDKDRATPEDCQKRCQAVEGCKSFLFEHVNHSAVANPHYKCYYFADEVAWNETEENFHPLINDEWETNIYGPVTCGIQ